jgi:acetyl-CoA C-acetyltransferase
MTRHAAPLERDAVIVAARRSPVGRAYKGSLTSLRPDDLAAQVIEATLADLADDARGPVTDAVTDVILGCAQPAGEAGYNLARVVTLLSGLPRAAGTTVNRYCASSLQSLRMAAHAVAAGEDGVYVAGGVETLSRYVGAGADTGPPNPRFYAAQQHTAAVFDARDQWTAPDPLPDPYVAMGATAEFVALRESVTREEMDTFAALSQQRAISAQDQGVFDAEIAPVTLPDGTLVDRDDCPRPGTTVETLSGLRPAFHPEGRVTAGNACPLNDGAAALVIMSGARAERLGLTPVGRILDSSVAAVEPELMGLGPVPATRALLERHGMGIGDVDLVEINEAFAAQVIPSARLLGIDWDRLNVNGGAIALGHPYGMTGARLTITLLNALRRREQTLGLATMCIGGGQGMALLVERLA